jgi:annexin A7/11
MKGIGCNDKAVMSVLCCRSNDQRQQIKKAFKTMYGKDLVEQLIKELSGKFEDVVVALLDPPGEYDAKQLRKAMAGLGTTESTLIEIMCSRGNAEIEDIKMAYRHKFARDLEKDLMSETSGDFRRLLVSMCAAGRDETGRVDAGKARQDADKLYRAGEKRLGTDEATFNAILSSQNFNQLNAMFQEYRKSTGHEIERALESEFSGDILSGWKTVVKCVKNRPQFFAEKLYESMKGLGTNDEQLIRVVVTRCEKDMVQIKQQFNTLYKKTLESFISGDTSGHYKNALLLLVQGN